ncbi:hypothetical protein [Pseudomonas aeruginosa]|uniref:hypothetical protein n=1 Tax=Pseudomonas aeruginosa TaxID=287 RepID=UPI001930F453|nr:hypothetical protein [Pseudomonas aeruginosa]
MPDHLPYTLHLGDCLQVLKTFPDNSFDSVVTDPPYGLTTNKKGGTGVASINLDSPLRPLSHRNRKRRWRLHGHEMG